MRKRLLRVAHWIKLINRQANPTLPPDAYADTGFERKDKMNKPLRNLPWKVFLLNGREPVLTGAFTTQAAAEQELKRLSAEGKKGLLKRTKGLSSS
jgi:hypothetical protein